MARLGIAITRTAVRAVLMRRARIVWHGEVDRIAGESMRASLERLLATVPMGRAFALRVTVAIGSSHSQLKQIEGLPSMKQTKHRPLLSRIVRENSAAFFLRVGSRMVVSDVDRRADGTNRAAAFDADIVDELLATLKKRRIQRVSLLPHVAALAPLLPAGTHRLTEDDIALEVTTADGGRIQHVRRFADRDASIQLEVLPAVGVAISAIGPEYLAAYGAATVASRAPFAWRPEPDAQRTLLFGRVRVMAASLMLVTAAVAVLVAPGVRGRRTVARVSAELATSRGRQIEAARVEGVLRSVSGSLDRIERFRAARGETTMLLGAISEALPESTAMLSLRVDSLEGSFTALTPHAADILSELSQVDRVMNSRIVGSVTRENQGQARVERATIRFRRQRDPLRAPRGATSVAATHGSP